MIGCHVVAQKLTSQGRRARTVATITRVLLEVSFGGARLVCAACDAISDKGGAIAPQLDGIGGRGAACLLEDMP